jgi:hypothetical protein
MDKKVEAYIQKQPSPQQEICRALRELILKTFPGIKEEMKWGVPAYADGNYYIVALKDHVNLGFTLKGLTKGDEKLFDGGGKTMMHVKVSALDDIGYGRIIKLLKLVDSKAVTR